MKKHLVAGVIFFLFGVALNRLFDGYQNKILAVGETVIVVPSPTFAMKVLKYDEIDPEDVSGEGFDAKETQNKFTISESGKISTDKTAVQTGETVNFKVTLKNTDDKRKFLTHICFNHTGRVTFGCVRNVNLEAGQESGFENSMMFSGPGTYSVWTTWSQDHVNFYRPLGAGTARVKVE